MSTCSPAFSNLCLRLGVDMSAPGDWLATNPALAPRAGAVLAACDEWLAAQERPSPMSMAWTQKALARWAGHLARAGGDGAARAAIQVLLIFLEWARRRDMAPEGFGERISALCSRSGTTVEQAEAWIAALPCEGRRKVARLALSSFSRDMPGLGVPGGGSGYMGAYCSDWAAIEGERIGHDHARALTQVVTAYLRSMPDVLWEHEQPSRESRRKDAAKDAAAPAPAAQEAEAGADPLDHLCALLGVSRGVLQERIDRLTPKRMRISCPSGLRAFSRWMSENRPGRKPVWTDLTDWQRNEPRTISTDMASQHYRGVASVLAGILEGTPVDRFWEKRLPVRGSRKADLLDALCAAMDAPRHLLDEWLDTLSEGRRHIAMTSLRRYARWMPPGSSGIPSHADIEQWHRDLTSDVTVNAANRYRQSLVEWLEWLLRKREFPG